jgi:hypothetical protein
MFNGPNRNWRDGENRRFLCTADVEDCAISRGFSGRICDARSYRGKQRELIQKATKDTTRPSATTKDEVSAYRRDHLGGTGQILPLHVFLELPRRIASNVGPRPPSPHLLSPFASFAGPNSLGKAGTLTGGRRFSRASRHGSPTNQKQTGGQNTDRHLQRAELTREFRFPFSDFCENHDHRDRRASLCDRRHVKVRYRRSDLGALPGDVLR